MKTKRYNLTTARGRFYAAYQLGRVFWNEAGVIPEWTDAAEAAARDIILAGREPAWPDGWRPYWGTRRQQAEVWKDRLWRKHGDRIVERNAARNLSPVMSALARLDREASDHWDDLSAFNAPSECYDDERRWLRRRFLATLNRHHWGEETLASILPRRVCVRWLHFHGPSISY